MLNFYKSLIDHRRREPALNEGTYTSLFCDRQQIAYVREAKGTRFLIVLNMTHRPSYFTPENFALHGVVEISTEPERNGMPVNKSIALSGDEGIIVRLKNPSPAG
jgi:alpha-glucosidase